MLSKLELIGVLPVSTKERLAIKAPSFSEQNRFKVVGVSLVY